MLCYGAVIRSGQANSEQLGEVIEKLSGLSSKRSYLIIPAYKIIIEALDQLTEKSFGKHVWTRIVDNFKTKALAFETLWLMLEINSKFPKFFNPPRNQEVFGRSKIIDPEFLKTVADILMGGSVRLRFLAKTSALSKFVSQVESEGLLEYFWLKQVEPKATKVSLYKSSVVVLVMNTIIANIEDESKIPKLITDNLVDIYLFHLTKTEASEMETVVLATFDKLIGFAGKSTQILKPVLKSLLTGSGNIAFDKVTGSTIVQRLVFSADEETVKMIGELLLEAMLGTTSDINQPTSKERANATHQLAKLMSHPKTNEEVEWKIKMISFVLMVTMFEIKKPILGLTSLPKPFSREAKVELKPVFFKALDLKSNSLETLCNILHGVATNASKLLEKSKSAALINPLDEASINAWKEMMQTVEKIRSVETKRKEDIVFQLLFIQIGFQLFSDPSMAVEVLSDLHICYDKSKKKKTKKRRSETSEEPEWIEVVVDLLLSLLSQNKHVLRQVVGSVMTVLSPHINDNALQAIVDVINPPKEGSDEENDEMEVDENGIDEESESDEEEEDENDESVEDENVESGEESEDENVEGEESEEEDVKDTSEVDEEFRNRVMAAMGKHAATDKDDDQDSINLDDLDDEDLAKMDEALSNIFKSICKKKSAGVRKKEQRDALAEMHFKVRALDMIDIYLSHNPKLAHVLFLIQPIIAAMEEAIKRKDQIPLQNRLVSTLKKITNLKKLPIDESLSSESYLQMLHSLIEWANSSSPVLPMLCNPMPLFAQCCSLVLKYGEKFEELNNLEPQIIKIYDSALKDFFVKNHCPIPMSFFLTPLAAGCKGALTWAADLTQYAFASDTRPYRRTHAIGLLTALLRSPALADQNNKLEVKDLLAPLVSKLCVELKDCIRTSGAKPRYFCEILNLVLALHSTNEPSITCLKEPLEEMWDFIPTNRHFQDVKKAYNKVATLFKIKLVMHSDKKRIPTSPKVNGVKADGAKLTNGDTDTPTDETTKKKKKKKKPSKEALKKKKERKLFELEGQFEGQEMPSFAGIVMNENMNFSVAADGAKVEQTNGNKIIKKRKQNVESSNGKKDKIKKKKLSK